MLLQELLLLCLPWPSFSKLHMVQEFETITPKRRYLPLHSCSERDLFCSKSASFLEGTILTKPKRVWGKAKTRPKRHSAVGKHSLSFIPYRSLVPFFPGTGKKKILMKPQMTQGIFNFCSETGVKQHRADLKPYKLGICQSSLCRSIPGQPRRCWRLWWKRGQESHGDESLQRVISNIIKGKIQSKMRLL